MSYDIDKIKKHADEIFDSVVAFRRELHMHPELSEQEIQTEQLICKKLDELGIPYKNGIAGHGIHAVIDGKNTDHAVGIRADMDALPLTENVDVPFKSQVPGVMHGCGHDIHTAILLGTAEILNAMKDQLPGSVSLLFQPSEETIGGAEQMILAGCLNQPKVDSVIGLHVESDIDSGSVEFISGTMNAASCEFYVTVTGESCHGAHPSVGIDPLLPACTMVTSIQSIVTRRIEPAEAALITVGQFHSGTKNNIIPEETKFSGIIRTLNVENRSFIKNEIKRLCQTIAEGYGAKANVEFHDSYPSLENDDRLMEIMTEAADEVIGKEKIHYKSKPSMGADDFSYFCHGTRGFYYNIGIRRPGEEFAYPIHSEKFNPDEECIRTGILTETLGVLKILEEECKEW